MSSSRKSDDLAPRASGKRRRVVYNPHGWASSILTQRSKVLALGVSYPCVRHQIRTEISSKVNLHHVEESVEQAVELVRRSALTQMDGRDLARVLALESSNDTHCYTVSLERGATYGGRHTTANFNRPAFCAEIKNRYGTDIKFRQIILDYYWIPSGTWQRSHWRASFFNTTLPNFVRENLLDFSPGLFDEDDVSSFSTSGKGGGVIYLPFCLHCIQQIIAAYDVLSKFYTIEFVYKQELSNHALWAATSTIDPKVMQNWLGKAINQEEVYCSITPSEVLGALIDDNVTREEILDVLRRIENFYDVRMIKLRALQMYNPSFIKEQCKGGSRSPNKTKGNRKKRKKSLGRKKRVGIDIGGFIGLKNKQSDVMNGFVQKDLRVMEEEENLDEDLGYNGENKIIDDPNDENCSPDQRDQGKNEIETFLRSDAIQNKEEDNVNKQEDENNTAMNSEVVDEQCSVVKVNVQTKCDAQIEGDERDSETRQNDDTICGSNINVVDETSSKENNDDGICNEDDNNQSEPCESNNDNESVIKENENHNKVACSDVGTTIKKAPDDSDYSPSNKETEDESNGSKSDGCTQIENDNNQSKPCESKKDKEFAMKENENFKKVVCSDMDTTINKISDDSNSNEETGDDCNGSTNDTQNDDDNNQDEPCESTINKEFAMKENKNYSNVACPDVDTTVKKVPDSRDHSHSNEETGGDSNGSAFLRHEQNDFCNKDVENNNTETDCIFEKHTRDALKTEVVVDFSTSCREGQSCKTVINQKSVQMDDTTVIKNDGIVESRCKDTLQEGVINELDQQIVAIKAI